MNAIRSEIKITEDDFVNWAPVKKGDQIEIRINGKTTIESMCWRDGAMGIMRKESDFYRELGRACHPEG